MSFPVLYDACVLYPAPLRDFLIRIARTKLVQVRWTDKILDECFRSILRDRGDLSVEQLDRTRQLMNTAIPDVLVTGYEPLMEGLALPDPDDVHVLAAAIKAKVKAIVTFNLRDFPATVLAQHGIEALHPDRFVCGLVDLDPEAIGAVIQKQAAALKSPVHTVYDILEMLSRSGLTKTATKLLRPHRRPTRPKERGSGAPRR